jgi:hypothetical protein
VSGRARTFSLAVAALAVAASRFASRARVPDDYDSIGFVRGIAHFDLAALQPHFPGYPVYVALGKLASSLVGDPLLAATLISALAAGATALALFRIGTALGSERTGWTALALYAVAALPWLLGGAALSDGTATAFAAWSFALLTGARPRPALSALLLGLMLGVRASYAPFALSWLLLVAIDPQFCARDYLRQFAAGTIGLAAWLVPFVLTVGGRTLWKLGRTHLTGHFVAWGGAVTTRPGLWARSDAFLRGLVYDGLAPQLGVCIALALLVGVALTASGLPSRRGWRTGLVVALPYGLWVLFGQNVLEQPRHLLPLVVGLILLVARAVGDRPRFALPSVALMGMASLPLVLARVHTPPAAAQAAAWVAATYPHDQVAVFGGRAVRFFDPSLTTRARTWLSEVEVDVQRLRAMPHPLLVTSEVEVEAGDDRARGLHELRRFCRDPRLDRAQPCLTLYTYEIPR